MKEPTILYEDSDVVVIDKPEGFLVHEETSGGSDDTVVAWLLRHAPAARGVGESQYDMKGSLLERSGVVHRLDRNTSGVLILAKTQQAYEYLKKQFHERHVMKEYHAIVYGYLHAIKGRIENPIGRSRSDPRLRSAFKTAKGTLRDAVTDWELIKQNASFAYVRVMPKTGRTHQIRAHLTSIQRPIVGDVLYASRNQITSTEGKVSRMMLHARTLTLTLPSGEQKAFIAPLPREFNEFLSAYVSENEIKNTP